MRPLCACTYCKYRNFAQQPPQSASSPNSSDSDTCSSAPRGLCLVCERAEQRGKNDPAYGGCGYTCRCRLERKGLVLCADCAEQNALNPRRHRSHGFRLG
ncbi:hypothetical protein DL766_001252 [Monosporascus sp. MC13-8B]|uniref:Stc1 domain-containing protein n=1 Tax=Monosporascus cannonballus TaxID=155416 RepID=A0ABY0H9X3_9PEZI|nr:hypothetical protein DL762_003689 [Monosporascus cannonballus]RYO96964.1 hypothetical protein DL763_003001 [Monosporascus cannonballus]RYP37955.1 hypothetical protein DL766_001252 [Monosporascus sp. MC13-8B]